VAGTLALLGLLAAGCGGGAGDDAPPGEDGSTGSFCARVADVGDARGSAQVRRALILLRQDGTPHEMTQEARAGLRLTLRLARGERSVRTVRGAARELPAKQRRRIAAFSAYAVTTCGIDPLAAPRRSPRPSPSGTASREPTRLPSGHVTELPTDLPTDIFPELSDFPSERPATRAALRPSVRDDLGVELDVPLDPALSLRRPGATVRSR
jgi:hypothetical protein